MDDSERFWDDRAESYAKSLIRDEESYQRKLDATRAHLRPDMEVLEFGCGTGSTALLHAPYVKHVHAIDFSQKMIDIAREKAAAAGVGNVSFERATLEELPDGRRFGAVLGLNVLHLMPDWKDAVARSYALLESGGVFVASTVCLGNRFRFFSFLVPLGRRLGFMPHLELLKSDEVDAAYRSAGFEILDAWQHGGLAARFTIARKPQKEM